jgi:HEAT repeat protein
MSTLVRLLLLVLLAIAVLQVLGLVLGRWYREARAVRRSARTQRLRALILTALLGEPDEAARARTSLRSGRDASWADVEDQAFRMISKIRGDSRDELVTLLLSRGAAVRATSLTRSRSPVRRARGAYRLGALGQRDSLPVLFGLLRDRAFGVRRTAARALGQVGDPLAVTPLMEAVASDARLARDVLAAVQRLGAAAAAPLARELRAALDTADDSRRAPLAAMGLGLLGDVSAAPLLVEALRRGRPALAESAAGALGALGAPEAVDALLAALGHDDAVVARTAADALGAIGDPRATGPLARALVEGRDHQGCRAVAGALLRLGPPGTEALADSGSPYAAEALAVRRVREGV